MHIRSLILISLLLSACAAPPAADNDIETGTGALQSSDAAAAAHDGRTVAYATVDGREVNGYLAVPSGSGSHPALVLIHEWWGLNDNIRDLADDFARQGYVALAVDLYKGESTTDQKRAGELAAGVQADVDSALDNLGQAVAFLKAQPMVKDDALASVGWCFGGGWAYQMARNDLDLDATVMYYGRFSPHDDFSHMKTDIIGHFGEDDMSISVDNVREFQATLATTNGDHEIYIYPNAGHAFANEDNEQAYNPEAAALAWQRTIDFLSAHVE